MAAFTLTDAHVIINGVTLSDHANEVTVNDSREQVDMTTFGATSKIYGKGLGDGTITIKLLQDFAAGETHATLQPLIGSTTPVTIEVRATSAARSATNPAVVMSALLFEYQAIAGGIGAVSETTATFQNAASAGITYPTA
jgi:hypothetical protein